MKNLLIALLFVFAATFASAQGSVLAGGPTVVNPLGQPIPGSTVAVCNTNPGSPTTGGCPGHLATLYTDVTAGTPCSGTAKPLSNPGGAGSGCSNPGTVDGRGNAVAFAASGQYWCEYYGTGLTGVAVQPCVFPSTGGSFSSVNLGTLPADFRVTSSPCSSGACLLTFDWSLSLAPNFLNQPLTLVRRDLNGDFQAGLITAGDFCLTSDPTKCLTTVGGGGSPGGADKSIQFKDGIAFGGATPFTYTKATQSLKFDNSIGGSFTINMADPTTPTNFSLPVYAEFDGIAPSAGVYTAIAAEVGNGGTSSLAEADAIRITDAFVNAGGGATIADLIGLNILSQTAGINNFAIKTGLGKVDFGNAGSGSSYFYFDPDNGVEFRKGGASGVQWSLSASEGLLYNNFPDDGGVYEDSASGGRVRIYGGTANPQLKIDSQLSGSSFQAADNFFDMEGTEGTPSVIHSTNADNLSNDAPGVIVSAAAAGGGKNANALTASATAASLEIANAVSITAGRFKLAPETPASSAANCQQGQIATDATYIYVCTSANTWKRAALSSF